MIEELKNTEVMNRIGGRFRLSALIQKRMLELMQGARPLIEDVEDWAGWSDTPWRGVLFSFLAC